MKTHKCTPLPRLTEKQAARILSKIQVGTPSECWLWIGLHNTHGYGVLRLVDQPNKPQIVSRDNIGQILTTEKTGAKAHHLFRAHRLMWMLIHGTDPGQMEVLHSCDNPPCCNPSHLRLGTASENMFEKTARGRQRRFGNQKLTAEDVRKIRASPGMSQRELAEKYNVDQSQISAIISRKRWKSVI